MCGPCRAGDPVKGEATFSASDGFARLVLKLADDVDSDVSTAGTILVIHFKQPVDIPVDQIADAVPDYIASARRDPDGMAIRLSLARRVTINTMSAGERIFVDLLPDSWNGPPPSLPPEVIRELAERARAAERALRQQRATMEAKRRAPIRVRTSVQPTFVRFVFEMPDGVGVSSVLNEQKLKLAFSAALNFDLADAKLAAPANIASINQKIDGEASVVEIALIGDVDVHSFREDKNYIVDVAFQPAEKPATALPVADASGAPVPIAAMPKPEAAKSETSKSEAAKSETSKSEAPKPEAAKSEKPADAAPTPRQSSAIVPPTSEAIAKQANIEIRPDGAPAPPVASEAAKMPAPSEAQKVAEPAPAKVTPSPSPAPEASPKMNVAAAPATAAEPVEKPVEKSLDQPSDSTGSVSAMRDSEGLHLKFSFNAATPAALFRRADTVWLVFDAAKPIDIEPIRSNAGAIIAETRLLPLYNGQAIRIRLNRPQMPSLVNSDRGGNSTWTLTFADTMLAPTQPLTATRNITDPAHADVTVMLAKPGRLHRIIDPDAGDTLMVVTATPPVRGFIKRQDFVEMSLLESIHGVAIRSNSDDVTAEIAPDRITIGRPGGLTLSSAGVSAEGAPIVARPIFDEGDWKKNQSGSFFGRQDELIAAEAAVPADQRNPARIELAKFYLARGFYREAKAVLDLALADAKSDDAAALLLHSVASTLTGRPVQGLKDLANQAIGSNYDAELWKGFSYARQGKWAPAREKFKNAEFAITALPVDLQRILIADAMRASLEIRDYSGADKRSSDLEVVGIPEEQKPAIAVMRGRLAEALGRDKDALAQYKLAIDSPDRQAATEAKLDQIALLQKRGEIRQPDALRELETLSVTWRGDELEVRALESMAKIYADTGRYSESLAAVKSANELDPNSELSRQGQDAAAALFSDIFLGSKGDNLPPVDALGLFYEFRELTPIGRRGDEMIRRLADRLVAVDLLDQASELLQYQVDHRLEGAARAQVAARLAMVYLTNRKPDRAIAALRTTRIADLSGELRQQRLLLEARAQSDVGRHDLALDIISNISGREAIRLRSDIYWASRRWREASEQIELYYGDRWRDFTPLNPAEKGDVIRAVVGYALAEDAIGLARFREKYAPLMSGDADRAAFETASKPASASSAEFGLIAKMAASVDTLEGFLREMKTRFPDATARATLPPDVQPAEMPTGALPEIVGLKKVSAAK